MRNTKDAIVDMWIYGVNKFTILNFAYERLVIPTKCKSEKQKREYVLQYVQSLINKSISERRKMYDKITD